MDQSIIILVLLGLAAALMPLQFAYEVYLFGEEDGVKKAAVFVGGITFFRVLLLLLVGVIFAGLTAVLAEKVVGVAQFAQRLLSYLSDEVTSGHRAVIDLLLVLSGILLIFEAYRYYVRSKVEQPQDQTADEVQKARSYGSLFLLGLGWAAISINQWLFILTAANHILESTSGLAVRLLLSLLFLLLASLLLFLPFVIYLFKRESTVDILKRLNERLHGTFRYVIVALMVAAGLYLMWMGGQGLLSYFR